MVVSNAGISFSRGALFSGAKMLVSGRVLHQTTSSGSVDFHFPLDHWSHLSGWSSASFLAASSFKRFSSCSCGQNVGGKIQKKDIKKLWTLYDYIYPPHLLLLTSDPLYFPRLSISPNDVMATMAPACPRPCTTQTETWLSPHLLPSPSNQKKPRCRRLNDSMITHKLEQKKNTQHQIHSHWTMIYYSIKCTYTCFPFEKKTWPMFPSPPSRGHSAYAGSEPDNVNKQENNIEICNPSIHLMLNPKVFFYHSSHCFAPNPACQLVWQSVSICFHHQLGFRKLCIKHIDSIMAWRLFWISSSHLKSPVKTAWRRLETKVTRCIQATCYVC